MSISNHLEDRILNAVFNNTSLAIATPYVSLHTADPGETGGTPAEVTGGSYARQLGSFGNASAGALENDAVIAFAGMPAVTVTHVGIYDAATAGNLLWSGALSPSRTLTAGDTFQFAIGALDVTLD